VVPVKGRLAEDLAAMLRATRPLDDAVNKLQLLGNERGGVPGVDEHPVVRLDIFHCEVK